MLVERRAPYFPLLDLSLQFSNSNHQYHDPHLLQSFRRMLRHFWDFYCEAPKNVLWTFHQDEGEQTLTEFKFFSELLLWDSPIETTTYIFCFVFSYSSPKAFGCGFNNKSDSLGKTFKTGWIFFVNFGKFSLQKSCVRTVNPHRSSPHIVSGRIAFRSGWDNQFFWHYEKHAEHSAL